MSVAAVSEPDGPSSARARAETIELASTETFEQALVRETLRSERLRLGIIAVLLGINFIRWVAIWLFAPLGLEARVQAPIDFKALTVLSGIALVYEVVAVAMVTRALRHGYQPPRVARYVNAFIETSIPTLSLVFGVETSSPAYLLALPIPWFYFLFIMLSTLRLDFRLCAFTGFVAAVEYAWLAAHYPQPAADWPDRPEHRGTDLARRPSRHPVRVRPAGRADQRPDPAPVRRALRSVEDRHRVVGCSASTSRRPSSISS